MSGQLSGRKILITGAASGMGRAIAALFAAEGAATALLDINAEALNATTNDRATAIPVDLASPDAVQAAVGKAADTLGGLDGVVNAAGILRTVPFAETDLDLWRKVLEVNLQGPYLVCHAALPHLQAAKQATIVNIASLAGLIAPMHMSAYAASKGGLISFTKVLAVELGPTIRANAIAPGIIKTPMTNYIWDAGAETSQTFGDRLALKRLGEPEEIAKVALFLTSDQSSFMTGTVTAVDGGSSWH